MPFFNRTSDFWGKITSLISRLYPLSLFYASGFSRKVFFRFSYFCLTCYAIGYFRRPYIIKRVLQKEQQSIQQKGEAVQQTLSKLQIKLNDFNENYFIIIAGHCSSQRQEELQEKQRIAFQLNNQINSKLQISPNFYNDIKILFIGNKNIYELLQANKTIVQLYEKEKEFNDTSAIYIFARQADGSQKFLSSLSYKADLNSILRIISKHKARKFAASLQF